MKIPLFKHALTGKQDALLTATVLSILLVAVRFFVDGVTFHVFGHTMAFDHVNPASYATLLSPIAGAHGVHQWTGMNQNQGGSGVAVDNPDVD